MRGWMVFMLFVIAMNTCRAGNKAVENGKKLDAIEDVLYEQLLYMGDDYIEELEDEMVKFDLPESEFEQAIRVMPDGTFRVWYTKDGVTWQYGAVVDPKIELEDAI